MTDSDTAFVSDADAAVTELVIRNGRCLEPDGTMRSKDLFAAQGRLQSGANSAAKSPAPVELDAAGMAVLPGLVDLHGDAFERQLMPRPGVDVPLPVALQDTDRQMLSAGITTAYHGVTYSWEPGLRSRQRGQAVIEALRTLRPALAVDTHVHLRLETFNLEAAPEVARWIDAGMLGALAFNDHTSSMFRYLTENRQDKLSGYAHRTGLTTEAFGSLLERVRRRAAEVPAFIERMAALAKGEGLPLLSHDDDSFETRDYYQALGCQIAEFPLTEAVAMHANERRSDIVFGAPNVMRGGSHNNAPDAAQMVRDGACTALASDYYYPSMLHAAVRLVNDEVCDLGAAWSLVSRNPARAMGLDDRGELRPGLRADLLLVEGLDAGFPSVAATVVSGKAYVFKPEVLVA